MSHPSDYPMSIPRDFSDLEVHYRRTDEGLKEVLPQQPGRLFIPNDGFKEVNSGERSGVLQFSGTQSNGTHLSATSLPSALSAGSSFTNLLPDEKAAAAVNQKRSKRICGLSIKGFWLLLAMISIVLAVAVGVSVGVYIHKSNSTAAPAPTTTGMTVVTTPIQASATASSLVVAPTREPSSGLASVAWNDTNNVMQYRIYYQDNDNQVKESAWDASTKKWQETQTIGIAKAKSPITAAVTGPQDFVFELSVYGLADNGTIIEWTSKDTKTFGSGNMTSQAIKPANVSGLTAIWDRQHGCPNCANTLLFAYERADGQLEIGNYTTQGWEWTTLQSSPASGTDLALALRWQSAASGDIRLFYQTKDGHLVSQDYNGPRTPPAFTWISREAEPISQLTSISPLTSFTYGNTPKGDALYNDMISANSSGVSVNWWSGVYNMNGNGEIPPALAGIDATALASNADKHIYALQQNGTIAEFQMMGDEYHWTYVGKVNTG